MSKNKYLEKTRQLVLNFLKGTDTRIYLFGSWCRNQQTNSSDIDIAIELKNSSDKNKILQLREFLEESSIPYRVDIVDFNFVSETLRQEILREGILWKSY